MALYRRAAKRDASEGEVVTRLEEMGASVVRHSGKDEPDLIVGWRGIDTWVEVKTPGREKAHKDHLQRQATFAQRWQGRPVVTLRNAEDATRWLLGLRPTARMIAAHARRLDAEIESLEGIP